MDVAGVGSKSLEEQLMSGDSLRLALDLEGALSTYKEALKELKQTDGGPGSMEMRRHLLLSIADIQKCMGKWDEALDAYSKMIFIFSKAPFDRALPVAWMGKGEIESFRGNYSEAMASLESAMETAVDGKDRLSAAASQCLHGSVLMRIGQDEGGKIFLDQALAKLKDIEESPEAARVLSSVYTQFGLRCIRRGELDEAVEWLMRALASIQEQPQALERAEASRYLGAIYSMRGDYRGAFNYLLQALEISKINRYAYGKGRIYNSLGQTCMAMTRFSEAHFFLMKADKIFMDLKAEIDAAAINGKLGNLFLFMEDYSQAIQFFSREIEMCRKSGNSRAIAYANRNLAESYIYKGESEKAIAHLKESLFFFESAEDRFNAGKVFLDLCYAFLTHGSLSEADEMASKAQEALKDSPHLYDRVYIKELIGIMMRYRKEWSASRSHFDECLSMLDSPSFRMVDIYFEYGMLHLAMKEEMEAVHKFRQSLALCRKLGLKKQGERILKMLERIDELELVRAMIEGI
ncbi:MAG: tetratricopeptide repeat protein [bacterium]